MTSERSAEVRARVSFLPAGSSLPGGHEEDPLGTLPSFP
jgi:hypothetical protein